MQQKIVEEVDPFDPKVKGWKSDIIFQIIKTNIQNFDLPQGYLRLQE